ncbi:hypothetical protein C1H46_035095 [Malus baccata]|uniref:Uncharacterized protein n=1 Tax=Malus baccata TaxID=106549 RepID=A0A540KYQ4_MALBA|nr:hypothetical protein C1H46_035095 [Malus baccata]
MKVSGNTLPSSLSSPFCSSQLHLYQRSLKICVTPSFIGELAIERQRFSSTQILDFLDSQSRSSLNHRLHPPRHCRQIPRCQAEPRRRRNPYEIQLVKNQKKKKKPI